MIFYEKLKELRKAKGWTQSELANKIGVQREQVSAYERGKYLPTTECVLKIANLFEVSIDYLLREDEGKQIVQRVIRDKELFQQIEELDSLAEEKERKQVKDLIDTVLWKIKLQNMVLSKQ